MSRPYFPEDADALSDVIAQADWLASEPAPWDLDDLVEPPDDDPDTIWDQLGG